MDTYDQVLINFHTRKKPDTFEIVRNDGYSSVVPVLVFFEDTQFSEIESLALSNCNGTVLDVGAGAGRHSSELQRRGIDVTAIDISEHAVNIMKDRGIRNTICNNILDVSVSNFDTLLMLMNGIGMVGIPEQINLLLLKSCELLNRNGVILVDSIDVTKSSDPVHTKYREDNISSSRYPGQQTLRINYNCTFGAWFNWLHLTFEELSNRATQNEFIPELLKMNDDGNYLAKLHKCT